MSRYAPVVSATALILIAADARPPAFLAAGPTALVYAQGDTRRSAVTTGGSSSFHALGTTSDGTAIVAFDVGGLTYVQLISSAFQTRTVKSFPRGTPLFRGNNGFVAFESGAQLARRYDLGGTLVGQPVATTGARELLGVGESIVALGSGRLRVWDRSGRLLHETLLEGNSLVPLPDDRFAVNDVRDGEVRAYTTALEQTATLRYVGLPARTIASAPDGTLAVLAGTPACTQSNAEIDVFTDLHAQPVARIHDNLTNPAYLAMGSDYVYAMLQPCQSGQDPTVATFTRTGEPRGVMQNLGPFSELLPFVAARP